VHRERERKREKENAAYDCSAVCTKELLSAFSLVHREREREKEREKENAAHDCSAVCTKELLSAFSPHRNGPPWRRRRGLMQRQCGAANKETMLLYFIIPACALFYSATTLYIT
jgi:hypothetical protein